MRISASALIEVGSSGKESRQIVFVGSDGWNGDGKPFAFRITPPVCLTTVGSYCMSPSAERDFAFTGTA